MGLKGENVTLIGGMRQPEKPSTIKEAPAIDIAAWRQRIRESTFANYHYEMGVALHWAGAPEQAMAALLRALEQMPAMAEARLELVRVLRDLGRKAEAEQIERQAIADNPSFLVDALYRAARRHCEAGRYGKAEEICRAVLDLDAGHVGARVLAAVLRLAPSDGLASMARGVDPVAIREAAALLPVPGTIVPEADPLLGWELFGTGRRMLRHGQTALCGQLFEWAAIYDPDAKEISLYRELTRLIGENPAGSAIVLPELPAVWQDSEAGTDFASELAMDLFHIAAVMNRIGRSSPAQRLVKHALSIRPGLSPAYALLGAISRYRLEWANAAQAIQHAVTMNPTDPSALVTQGLLLQSLGHMEGGVASIRQALVLAPKQAPLQRSLGMALVNLGRFDDALAAFDEALALDPTLDLVLDYRVLALLAQGKLAEAEQACRNALARQPNSARLRSNLGLVVQAQGRLADALAEYSDALHGDGAAAWEHSSYGLGLLAVGRLDEAEAAHREALVVDPYNAWCHINLALTLHAQNRAEEALEAVHQGVKARPDLMPFHAALRPWASVTLADLFARCGVVPFA